MKLLVLGGYGAMGSVAVQTLSESGAEVIVAGRDYNKAESFATRLKNAVPTQMDATDKNLAVKIKSFSPDVLINATNYENNLQVMRACIAAKINYVDLGGLYHVTLKQLKLDKEARRAGIICLLGMGSTPGTTNVMANYLAKKFDRIKKVEIRSGWRILEKTDKPVIPYAASTILDEFTMPAPVLREGKIKFVNPMKTKINFEFEKPLGKVAGHYAIHSELATLPKNINKGIAAMDFAVAYAPKFSKLVEKIIFKTKNKEKQIGELEKATASLSHDLKDIDGQSVEIFGEIKNQKASTRMDASTTYFEKWKRGSAIDTGIPPAIAAQWIASGKIKTKGVVPPEIAFNGLEKKYFAELERHSGGSIKVRVFATD